MIGITNDKYKRWNKYFDEQNNFNLFDFASYDKNRNIVIHGRLDDTINIRGHRIGSGEIEAEIIKIKDIKEVSAISAPDKLEGERIIIFYTAKNKTKQNFINNQIKEMIKKYWNLFFAKKNLFY